MKKFILKISFFVLLILLSLYPIDYIISKKLSVSKYYAEGELIVWNDIFTGNINSDIVIYGSSRAWVQFSPRIFEDSLHISTYNLGIDGHNFWLQYFRHKELLKYNRKPKQIILSLDIFSLSRRMDLYNYEQFLPYLLWNNEIIEYISSYNGFSFFDYYIPLIRYFGESDSFIAALLSFVNFRNSDPERVKGYKGRDWIWNNDLEKAKSASEYYEASIDSASVELFERFINECKKDEIEIILVYGPEFIEGQLFVKNRKEVIDIFHDFADKYDLNFYDYSEDEISFEKLYFYNAVHLNKTGSEKFTNKLIRRINAKMHNRSNLLPH